MTTNARPRFVRVLTALGIAAALAGAWHGVSVVRAQPTPAERLPPPPRRGPAPPLVAVDAEAIARGARAYQEQCALCHGEGGRGDGPAAAGLSARPADQTSLRYMDGLTDADLAAKIQAGGFQMPAFPHVRGQALVDLVAFTRSLSRPGLKGVELHALAQGEVEGFEPVTQERLDDPPPEDWLNFRRTHDAWAFSPLADITRDNVATLRLAWSRAMEPGGQYSTPLVHRGAMYLAHPGDVIQALDATDGDLIWEWRWEPPAARADAAPRAPAGAAGRARYRSVRNIAILGDRLFHFTRDNHLVALDARTGVQAWAVPEAGRGIGHMAGPMVADGKIVSGRSCAATGGPEICYIAAHAPDDGRELWRVRLIPRPGEPGDETWGGLPYEQRLHVGAWGTGSYDPALKLVYWGTSVPAPSLEGLRGTPGQDVLFSNATLAIDVETGRVKWYYQHLPRDNWDLDHVFERVLVDTAVAPDPAEVRWINPALTPGETRRVVTGIPGKTGIVYTLDRETGEFLWARETIHQNVVRDIDPATGRVTIDESRIVGPFEEQLVCPSLGGGKDWPTGAYSPLTGLMYQPQQNMCMLLTGNTDRPMPADGYATSWVMVDDPKATPGMIGRVDAISASTGRTAWVYEQRAGMIGSLLAVAGGVVFGGDVNRRFYGFDDTTGEVLWETALSGPPTGHPISYAVDGRQYLAIPAGGDTASPEKRVLSLHPEIKPPQGQNAIFVFALPDAPPAPPPGVPAWAWALVGGLAGGIGGVWVARRGRRTT
ncbi:MAG: PQQ-binding-like beta-propeller repeat protein [Acidobacteria bacterium]|nr:PQQ-binding-like beta-propeller repeat protein [Acidobacteriota bacterium]